MGQYRTRCTAFCTKKRHNGYWIDWTSNLLAKCLCSEYPLADTKCAGMWNTRGRCRKFLSAGEDLFHCQIFHTKFHTLVSRRKPRSWAVVASISCKALLTSVLIQLQKYAWFCFFWNISLNFVVKYWSGVTYILISALNIFFKLGALPSKGTTGIGKETFELSGDSW